MTSPAAQQTANPASNTSATTSAPSYASAASAAKKPTSTPVVATGAISPLVAAGSSTSTSHHVKSSSISPMNGRPNIMPAIPNTATGPPAIVHSTSNVNGLSDHNRKGSVTMSVNGPNSYSANGSSVAKTGIQFGYQESPAVSHSSPAPGAVPIPIPIEPQKSPSPIPQPSASGGRPPSGAAPQAGMTFGSFGGESDRHMRTPSVPQDPSTLGPQHSPHLRRGSNVSASDHQGGVLSGAMARGNYAGPGRGRGYNNNNNYNQSMGYPPNNYSRGHQGGQGRGGMPPNFGNNRQQQFGGTPPGGHRSPALSSAMPQPPNMAPGAMPGYYYQPPPSMGPQQVPQVTNPFPTSNERMFLKNNKKGPRRDNEKFSNPQRRMHPMNHQHQDNSQRSGRFSGQSDPRFIPESDSLRRDPSVKKMTTLSAAEPPFIPLPQPYPVAPLLRNNLGYIDLSPASGNFERLTNAKQYSYPSHFDPNMRPGMPMQAAYPMYPMMQGQSPAPSFSQPYNTGPYNPPGAQPMSRNGSQVSADPRPTSSTSQHQAPVPTQGTPQLPPAQAKPAVVQSPQFNFHRPTRGSHAIQIKKPDGEALDLNSLKPPASPAPSTQQSKTPPIVSSTPTPPPKAATPKSFAPNHARSDSSSNSKTAEEVRNEFKEKMMRLAAGGEKDKDEETVKAPEEEAVRAPEEEAVGAPEEDKIEEQVTVKTEVPDVADVPVEEAKVEPSVDASTQPVVDAPLEEQKVPVTSAVTVDRPKPAVEDPEEDEIERQIREMEEADALREKQEAEHRETMEAEKAAKKKIEDETRAASAAENDRKLREQEREMERLEDEKSRKRAEREALEAKSSSDKKAQDEPEAKTDKSPTGEGTTDDAATKLANLTLDDKPTPASGAKPSPGGRVNKPAHLDLAQLNTKAVEAPQPSAALQSLKTARLLEVINRDIYPPGVHSPNPALNAAVTTRGKSFKYDSQFLLQFKVVFTEQPSLDFHQQVKSLIGDGEGGRSASVRTPAGGPGRQNSRGGLANFPMGSIGAPTDRTLPPGTTSEDRFKASGKSASRPITNPLASYQRPGGAFPGGSGMNRTPSTSNMGSMPHSPRQSSRRNASKQNTFGARVDAQAAKTMPLTAGLKIEGLSTSTSGWKPMSLAKSSQSNLATQSSTHMDPAMVQRKVKAALNKMTPDNFEKISGQILEIAGQSKDETDGRTLRQVIQLTFEKATDEAHWASMYARFCKSMLETMSPDIRDESIKDKNGAVVSGGALFRKYLLNRCQEEFERGWQVSLPVPKEGEDKKGGVPMLTDEYYIAEAAKRRGLGLVQFIGELYKLTMLTERIMHECVRKLVDYTGIPEEAEIESLSKLLRTIGANLDSTDKGKLMMDAYFQRIQSMIELPELPSRLQFMLMDVVDLRRSNWRSKEANKGPKTLDEVRAEAEAAAAQKAAEAARSNQRGGPGGRAQFGRGDARQFSSGFPQPTPNQVGMDDLRRLKGGANRPTNANITLGPMSMLGSRSNSGRRLGPGGSLSRGAEDSGNSSRTGTPPVRETQTSTNAFSLLANMDSDHPASPPSTAASPAMAKATPNTSAAAEKGSS